MNITKTIKGISTEFTINIKPEDIRVGDLLHEVYKQKDGNLQDAYFMVLDIYDGNYDGKPAKRFKLFCICDHETIDDGIEAFLYELPDDLYKPLEKVVQLK